MLDTGCRRSIGGGVGIVFPIRADTIEDDHDNGKVASLAVILRLDRRIQATATEGPIELPRCGMTACVE